MIDEILHAVLKLCDKSDPDKIRAANSMLNALSGMHMFCWCSGATVTHTARGFLMTRGVTLTAYPVDKFRNLDPLLPTITK
jgi:hypothetical protein